MFLKSQVLDATEVLVDPPPPRGEMEAEACTQSFSALNYECDGARGSRHPNDISGMIDCTLELGSK